LKPPPTVENPSTFSKDFNDFLGKCLIKDFEKRPTAVELMTHPFVQRRLGPEVLQGRIKSVLKARKAMPLINDNQVSSNNTESSSSPGSPIFRSPAHSNEHVIEEEFSSNHSTPTKNKGVVTKPNAIANTSKLLYDSSDAPEVFSTSIVHKEDEPLEIIDEESGSLQLNPADVEYRPIRFYSTNGGTMQSTDSFQNDMQAIQNLISTTITSALEQSNLRMEKTIMKLKEDLLTGLMESPISSGDISTNMSTLKIQTNVDAAQVQNLKQYVRNNLDNLSTDALMKIVKFMQEGTMSS